MFDPQWRGCYTCACGVSESLDERASTGKEGDWFTVVGDFFTNGERFLCGDRFGVFQCELGRSPPFCCQMAGEDLVAAKDQAALIWYAADRPCEVC